MLSAPGRTPELRQLARQFPELRLILDHMNVKVGGSDPAMLYERFVDSLPPLYELAEEPNVAVKISVLPRYANDSFPFISLHPHILNVIRTFGAGRCMWGSDVTQLPCSYSDWLKAMLMAIGHLPRTDQVAVMGGTLSRWLNWPKDMG
jgi:L-fuconolactonase